MAEEVRGSFFEKKEPKKLSSFAPGPQATASPRGHGRSFFCFFFVHKKEDSSL
jgi:hypothetical protein